MAACEKKLIPVIGDSPEALAELDLRMRAKARAEAEVSSCRIHERFQKYGSPGRRTSEQEAAYAELRASGKVTIVKNTVSMTLDEELVHCYILCYGCIASFVHMAPDYTSEDWARVVRMAREQGYYGEAVLV